MSADPITTGPHTVLIVSAVNRECFDFCAIKAFLLQQPRYCDIDTVVPAMRVRSVKSPCLLCKNPQWVTAPEPAVLEYSSSAY